MGDPLIILSMELALIISLLMSEFLPVLPANVHIN